MPEFSSFPGFRSILFRSLFFYDFIQRIRAFLRFYTSCGKACGKALYLGEDPFQALSLSILAMPATIPKDTPASVCPFAGVLLFAELLLDLL